MRGLLMLSGLYWRGLSNSAKVELRHNRIASPDLSTPFDGFTILQISDLDVEMSEAAMGRVAELVGGISYDICVLTGDYRAQTRLPAWRASISALKDPSSACSAITITICMVPLLEQMGISMLLNESETIERGGARIHLAGIDDAHFYRMDNIEKAAKGIPHHEFSILLSHTPEIFRLAAHADFNVLLSGHTHGGQLCLPGGVPVTFNCVLPRFMGRGRFKYHDMIGYTSAGAGACIVPVRFNCPPEITLHTFRRL